MAATSSAPRSPAARERAPAPESPPPRQSGPARQSDRPRHFDSLEQEAFLNLWRTYDRLRALEEALFDQWGLTPQQYNVLRLLRAELPGGLSTSTLGQRLLSRAPDTTRMLDRLEQRGLIDRHRPADNRRVVRVTITDAGTALLGELATPLAECHAAQLGHLGRAELTRLVELLRMAREPHEALDSPWR